MSISVTELGVGTDEELMDQLIGPGGPKVKDRKYRLRTYKECFLGAFMSSVCWGNLEMMMMMV